MSESERDLSETVDWAWSMAVRRRWWILSAASVVSLSAATVALLIPSRYSSEATLVVVQQQVSTVYVPGASTRSPAEAIQDMTREILSRAPLLRIVQEFGLYEDEKDRLTPDGLVARMREDVSVDPLDPSPSGNVNAFRVSFTSEDPQLAHNVTARLTRLFIDETLKNQGEQAAKTASFLTEEVEAARKKLADQEERLRAFKMSSPGELPEQQAANMAILLDLRTQLATTSASLIRARQQRSFLESAILAHLARLETAKAGLLDRFTPKHPDVIAKAQEIARIQELLSALRSGANNMPLMDDPSLAQLSSQAQANGVEIANLEEEERARRGEIARYQGRMALAPVREQQLTSLLRDYDLYKREYTDLMSKQQQSQLTASLEERRQGQHFRLIDPPTLPVAPVSPKRLKISLGGAAGGLLLGFCLAFLVDCKDRSFHTEKQTSHLLRLPLVAIPVILTPEQKKRRSRRRSLEWCAGVALSVVVFCVQYFVYSHS